MPAEHTYHPDGNYLEVTLSGTLTLQNITDEMAAFVDDGAWKPNLNVLWDCRGMDMGPVDQTFLDDLVAFRSRLDLLRRGSRAAILVVPDVEALASELARMLDAARLTSEVRVFIDPETALDWVRDHSGDGTGRVRPLSSGV